MNYLVFKDNGFKRAVEKQLALSQSKLTLENIQSITGIVVSTSSKEILPIPWVLDGSAFNMHKPNLYFNIAESENGMWEEDLKLFKHISSLYLFVAVGDLDYLRQFLNLSDLYVAKGSTTRDWSFLEDLHYMTYLFLNGVSFSDLEILQRLSVSQNKLISKSKKLNTRHNRLTCLCMTQCNINDVSPLDNCKWLTELDLSHNNITEFGSLLGLQSLYSLTLRYNCLSDLSFITDDNCATINYLNLRHNNIVDITSLVHMSEISNLYLGYNPIVDFSVLDQMQLRSHDIKGYSTRRKRM